MGAPKSKTCREVCFLAKQNATTWLCNQKRTPPWGHSGSRSQTLRRSSKVALAQLSYKQEMRRARKTHEDFVTATWVRVRASARSHSGPDGAQAQSPRPAHRTRRGRPRARRQRVPREGPHRRPPADTEEKPERRCSQDKRHTRCGAGLADSTHLVPSPRAGPPGQGQGRHATARAPRHLPPWKAPTTQSFTKNHVGPAP